MRRVVVIGAGVSGLTTALALAEAGCAVRVVARERWAQTTSAVAGGLWYPFLAEPRERVLAWCRDTLEWLYGLVEVPGAGVVVRDAHELYREPVALPWWGDAVRRLRRLRPEELPGGVVDGFLFETCVVCAPVHLAWLEGRLAALGVPIELRELRAWSDLRADDEVIVNCSGLGARALAADRALVPVRGQVVRARNPGLQTCFADDQHPDGLTYAICRQDDIILGGSAEVGEEDLTVDEGLSTQILARTAGLDPRLRGLELLDVRLGLRPVRAEVRVERDADGIVHNYGHGGSGFTLAWGCAREVVGLVGEEP